MTELIITEKPSSALKVAQALADGKLDQKRNKQCSYYELTHNKKPIIVTSAVGHLYGLVEEKKKGWDYPVFEIKWEQSNLGSTELKYVKDYIDTISMLAKKADEFTIACDYDVEGEVIGLNVVRFACKKKDANRMKFSTLTKPDLVEAYEHKIPHLDWGQAYAGETRHYLDWFYGINLSRALTSSLKTAGAFKVMSIGRVQGPALKLLVDREREIQAFVPEPYSMLQLEGEYTLKEKASAEKKEKVEAWHTKDKFFDQKEVESIYKKVKGEKEAKIKQVSRNQKNQAPPYPFDLTSLQSESYNLFKITPKETLALAQSLYLAGVTSYPRTSSQQLDPKLGFKKILDDLSQQPEYELLCKELLKKSALKPNNGKKTDPAHPAVYPTGLVPKNLKPREDKIYDLVVKRFLATFAEPAVRETMEVQLEVKEEIFIAKGTRTVTPNWHLFYHPYVNLEEITLPNMKEGEKVQIQKINKLDKETQPPKRFNQSSIIKELEKRNLGTKATRADILDRLFQRGYVEGVQITVSKFGMETIKVLEKHAPTIVDEKLTADFEEDMDKIREGKDGEGQVKQERVLEKAKKFLTSLLIDFRKKEKQIGADLIQSVRATEDVQNYLGQCPKCKEGRLMIKRGKFGRFAACDKYPACTTTFNLPNGGIIKSTDQLCSGCQFPLILIINKNRKQEVCMNLQCKNKVTPEMKKEISNIEQQKVEKKCPKCGKDLLVRRSVFGTFLGCSGFPKCRHTEKLENGGQKASGDKPAAGVSTGEKKGVVAEKVENIKNKIISETIIKTKKVKG